LLDAVERRLFARRQADQPELVLNRLRAARIRSCSASVKPML
jgi:hypothetical protein